MVWQGEIRSQKTEDRRENTEEGREARGVTLGLRFQRSGTVLRVGDAIVGPGSGQARCELHCRYQRLFHAENTRRGYHVLPTLPL